MRMAFLINTNSCRFLVWKKVQQSVLLVKHFANFSLQLSSVSSKPFSSHAHQHAKICKSHFLDGKQHAFIVIKTGNHGLRNFSSATITFMKKKEENDQALKKNSIVQVFDISDKLIGKMTLSKVEEMAKRDDLKIMDIGRNADNIPSFKLMTGKQLYEETMKQKSNKKMEGVKKEKEFRISLNISDHDLEVKLNQMKTIMKKGVNAKIVVKGDRKHTEEETNQLQSSLMKKITESVQDLATVKKSSKTTTDLVFILKAKDQPES